MRRITGTLLLSVTSLLLLAGQGLMAQSSDPDIPNIV